MRIALLSSVAFDSSTGGVENHLRFMCKELGRLGHRLVLFKPVFHDDWSRESAVVDEIETRYVDIGRRPYRIAAPRGGPKAGVYGAAYLNRLAYNRGYKRLASVILSWGPELVWQHDFSATWLASRFVSRHVPTVLTNHLGEYLILSRSAATRWLLPLLLRHYAAIIGPSRELTPAMPQAVTIPNGADVTRFTPVSSAERAQLRSKLFGAASDRFVIFCPRRWAPSKGVVYLAEALRHLHAIGVADEVLVVFAGDATLEYPSYREHVERVLDPVAGQIMRLGNLDVYDMIRYYRASDLTVIPSLMEATSLAAIESMACGTPVLATSVGGMVELIRNERNGFLVEPGSPDALAAAIRRLVAGQYDLQAIREAALRDVRESFDWRNIAKRTETVLLNAKERWTAQRGAVG